MNGKDRVGWLMAISHDAPSNWSDVTNFYRCMDGWEVDDNGYQIVRSTARDGLLKPRNGKPQSGDGFAIYHSTRAKFPDGDAFDELPRISLIGELLSTEIIDGVTVHDCKPRTGHLSLDRTLNLNPLLATPILAPHSDRSIAVRHGKVCVSRVVRVGQPAEGKLRGSAAFYTRTPSSLPRREHD